MIAWQNGRVRALVTFFSGLVFVPALVLGTALLIVPRDLVGTGNMFLWGTTGIASFAAALFSAWSKRMRMWQVIAIGPAAVLLGLTVLFSWALATGRA
jgi:hypothetical protein